MKFPLTCAVVATLLLHSCASSGPARLPRAAQADDLRYGFDDRPAASTRISGIVGISELSSDVEGREDIGDRINVDDQTLPLLAAAWQRPLRSERLELGVEAGFAFAWESERESVAIGNGTVIVFADNDFKLLDLSLGAYASTYLGERLRVYGGIGPVVQFAWVDIELQQDIGGRSDLNESGIGYGYYARVGAELELQRGLGVGLVARWLDTQVDLGGTLGDFETEAVQVGLVVTQSF